MKNNIYTAIPDWFNKIQSQSTDNTSTTTTQTTIIGGGGSISMSIHNLFIKSDTTITIDDFIISDLFVTDQITDTENWLTTPLLHTLPNTEVSVTTAAQQLYIGAYDKNNNQIKLYQFSEAISTVVIPENCYYLRASSNKTNTDLTIKYVGLNNFDETQQNKLESSSFQNFLTLVEEDEKGVITNSVQNLSLVFQNPLYYTLDKAGNVLISIDRDALFSQSENPTDDRYVTTIADSVQDILSSKNFKEGLSINGIEIVERNGFLYIKGNLATTGGITAYADDPDDPGSGGGLPGGGAIGDIVITGSGNALVDASLSEDHSVITFTKGWLVDAESDQSITGIKDFINGIKLDGQLIKIVDGVLFLDCSIAATGGITAYATMPGEGGSSIMDQLVVDTEYFIITEEGVLTIVPGSVGGISNIYVTGNGNALTTATLSEDGKTISFTKDKTFADDTEIKRIISEFKNEVNGQLKRFVTLDTEQEITAIKYFIEGITIGSNKHKFYEKDGVLWLEGDIAITGGITTYATENVDVSTIMDGVVVDEITITKGDDNVLRIKDGGAGSSFDENAMWSALSGSSDNQINKSHLTMALDGYATQNWVIENYATKSELSAVSNKLSDFLEGSDTDNIINKWKELEAFLSGMAETDNLAEILETKADKKYVDSTFVTLATKQTITGEKTFSSVLNTAAIKASGAITAPSLAASDYVTIAGIKLRKLEDGALMLEGNLALTGALTMYASNGQSFDTIYDGLPIDNDTIYWQEVDGSRVLKAREGSGSSFDKSAMWTALAGSTTEQINKSHLTTALTGYATESWVSGKNYAVKATTLAGYGITDAYTKTESDNKYPTKTGSGASGTWGIGITGNAATASKWATARTITLGSYLSGSVSLDGSANVTLDANVLGLTSQGKKTAATGNVAPPRGVTLYEVYRNGYPTSYGNLLSVRGGGAGELLLSWANANRIYYRSLRDNGDNWLKWNELAFITDNVASATKLQTARTIWGQSFDGTKPVTGALTSVTDITGTGTFTGANLKATDSIYVNGIRLHKTADGVITLEGNLAVTGGITMYAIDPVSASTVMDGVAVDGTTIAKVDGVLKVLNSGGGEAGSVAWGNITGKPSVFATNIANITDLHSSWDAVLKAQKPAWLTAVSIATISDLHANWDALLKAAPSAYVTRWPTISEVTNKKNLVVKLNGGTAEGTNLFTYNATGAKTINITPAGIGAAASSHNHSWSNITSGKPTTLAGYGITDAPTKTGSGASGTWGISISGNASNADKLDGYHESDFFRINRGHVDSTESSLLYRLNGTIVDTSTADWSGMYAGFCASGSVSALVFRVLGGGQGMNKIYMNYSVDGSRWGDAWRIIATTDSNVNSATQLLNKRNIWGQPFNGTADITGDMSNINDINMSGTLRIYGTNPLFYPSFGGGWYMLDTLWIRVYGNKSIYTEGMVEANSGFMAYASYSDTNSASHKLDYNNCAFKNIVDAYVNHNSSRSILGWRDTVSGYGYSTRYVIGSERPYNGNWGRMYLAVGNNDTGTSIGCSIEIWGNGQATVNGNLLVTGGVTLYGSDIRYKSIMHQVNLSLMEIAKAPSFVYHWNREGMKRDRLNLGGSAQYTQSVLPWAVEDNDNFLSMDYATVAYTFAVHTARHLLTYETRTDKKIKKLENRVKYLEKQLKKLGYEEASIVDN